MKNKKCVLLWSITAVLFLLLISSARGQRAVCDEHYHPEYACMGNCYCEGSGGGNGQTPCSFYCQTGEGDWWCGPDTEPRCVPERPI